MASDKDFFTEEGPQDTPLESGRSAQNYILDNLMFMPSGKDSERLSYWQKEWRQAVPKAKMINSGGRNIIEVDPVLRRDQAQALLMETYIDHYNKKSKDNRKLKITFFWLIAGFIMALIAGMIALSLGALLAGLRGGELLSIVLSSLASALSAIIVLPIIIANYLFPKQEDDRLLEYMISMHKEDREQVRPDTEGKNIKDKKSGKM